ncbi:MULTISPECIES: hypothetical protein [Leptolyngbya]|jgi:hypothetical protein|uniref:Acetyltransferase n=2 Tax=Leptolyngbya boryana TaxID=1184 RepID=A0A1Z4JKQ5_LEPBY|nr:MULTISPECIES: hypothetical protein [Leptolyngbya]BAY57339.1 hypothetical protein NIES2135_42040 [Leptolyngbya boryana NIES-2135]MBD1854019.1 acetyltransferase [Leptolyngbya sp. FACHB-1624]MBD2366910.1 acetyltransferase [Leptolyngbya sp. FACHB-161]MBD2373736.1 acetyltransferase [Leptolyngbya sp. FACHB-238]MBD2398145.1 acetyltransferase [Leptolyngbya sp. FACHB-239]
MLLQEKETGNLVEVLDIQLLIDPNEETISAKDQAGQEEQDPEKFAKTNLVFPSGEALPQCWVDANYRTR